MSATAELPSLEPAASATGTAVEWLSGFLEVVESLGSGSGSSPLGAVGTALSGVEERLDIDLSGITDRLPQALTTIRNALPEDSLRFVEELEQAYEAVMDFLRDSEVVKQIQGGASLEQTALALVDDVLGLFQTRLGELAANLVGAEELARITEAMELIESLRTDYAANADELLPFVSSYLLGVAPDLLEDATAHVDSALAVVAPFSDASLAVDVTPARVALTSASNEVVLALNSFDPADLSLYAALEVKLQALDDALNAAFDALETLYAAAGTAVGSHAWDDVFTTYTTILTAIPLQAIPTVDDAIDQIAGVLEDFLARLTMTFSPEDLAERITAFSTGIQESFAQSPLGQVRQVILDFLEEIRQTIESVPTEAVQEAVTQMLERIRQELDDLGITSIRETIAEGFEEAQTFIDESLGEGLFDEVEAALAGVTEQLEEIPIAEVGAALTEAVNTLGDVVQELEEGLEGAIADIRELLARLDELSFTPVADEVLEEINTLKTKLQSIRPESLSDAEKLAIQGGLALLRAIDLEGMITNELKNGFTLLGNELKGLINQVLAAWMDLRGRLGDFDPESVMGPLTGVLDQVTALVQQLNGATVLAPFYEQLEALRSRLAALSPGSVLDPLQAPYGQMMAVVERANPDVWVQPLRALHVEIDRLLGYVDITPLLDTLEQRERELFAQARQAIVDGLDSVHLPPPLDAFYEQVKLITVALSDAIFGDPEDQIREVNLELRRSVKLSTLFTPLDLAFDELLRMLDGVPHEDLVAVMEGLRSGIGQALVLLDPRTVLARLRQGQGALAQLSPAAAAGAIPALPTLRASLAARLELAPAANQAAAASLLARFDVTIAPVRPDVASSRLRRLQRSHEALVKSLRLKINALEATGAQAAYAALDANLSRLLPAFLRQSRPLTYDDIRAGLAEMRPSNRARRLDTSLDLFLSRLQPMESALEPAFNGFFRVVKDTALVIHPGSLKESVAGIYDTLREKLHVLDPDELAQELRENVYEPLLDPLRALDPAAIKLQIDTLYQNVLGSLTGRVRGLLDQIKTAVDGLLAQVRAAVADVLGALRAQVLAIVTRLEEILDALDSLIIDDLFGRLLNMIDNLEASFNRELDRVRNGFDAMLDAIPLGSGASAGASI